MGTRSDIDYTTAPSNFDNFEGTELPSLDEALDIAIAIVGEDYTELDSGVFLSGNREYLVRMTDSDLAADNNHASAPHINIERGYIRTKANGRMQFRVIENKHLFLKVR